MFLDRIHYSGPVITPGKSRVENRTGDTLEVFKYATNMTQLRSFLPLCIGYKRFELNFARKAFQLNNMQENGVKTKLDYEDGVRGAVDELIRNLIEPSILALPSTDELTTIKTVFCDE